jgi:Domain of unknown function (DUF5615)
MKLRLYLDEDTVDDDLVKALKGRGIDIFTAYDAGMAKFLDEQQLKYAAEQGRVLYSFNIKDYFALHTHFLEQGQSHAGIILAQQKRYSIGEQTRRILKLMAARSAEEMVDQVEFLSAW